MRVEDRAGPQPLARTGRGTQKPQTTNPFHVADQSGEAHAPARPNAPLAAGSISALLQLQIDTNPQKETRKRAIRRGIGLLDGLDRLRAALLVGADRAADWDALAVEYRLPRDADLPPEVAALLDEVDVRVAVELAKRGR